MFKVGCLFCVWDSKEGTYFVLTFEVGPPIVPHQNLFILKKKVNILVMHTDLCLILVIYYHIGKGRDIHFVLETKIGL